MSGQRAADLLEPGQGKAHAELLEDTRSRPNPGRRLGPDRRRPGALSEPQVRAGLSGEGRLLLAAQPGRCVIFIRPAHARYPRPVCRGNHLEHDHIVVQNQHPRRSDPRDET